MIKYGFIDKIQESDWRMGVNSNLNKKPINKTGNLTEFIPKWETQCGVYGDTMACVNFSGNDCLETIMSASLRDYQILDKYKDDEGFYNISDRKSAKSSGTTRKGNWFTKVAEDTRLNGFVPEASWNFPSKQRTPVFGWDDYYIDYPESVEAEGKEILNYFEITYELVTINHVDVREQLKYGPLQISYNTSSPVVEGIYQNATVFHSPNHAVMLYNITDDGIFEVLDHYERDGKGHIKFAADFQFGYWALQYFINPKEKKVMELKEGYLYQLVEGVIGGFAVAIDGKLYIDDLAKILATWEIKNNGNTKGKTETMTKAQWNSFEHLNLKHEKVD